MKVEDDIVHLNIQLEEGNNIVDCPETKLHNKFVECTKLEEEFEALRKELKDAKD